MKNTPVILFVVAIVGLIGFSLHRSSAEKTRVEFAVASEEFDRAKASLEREVAEIKVRQPSTQIRMTERVIERMPPASTRMKSGPFRFSRSAPLLTKETVRIPEVTSVVDATARAGLQQKQEELKKVETVLAARQKAVEKSEKIFGVTKASVGALFSLVILLACIYIILKGKYKSTTEKWAFAAVGTILGYWMG
jgi:hypothetical protein